MNALDSSLAAAAPAAETRGLKTGEAPPQERSGAFDAVFADIGRPEGRTSQDAGARFDQMRPPSKGAEAGIRERKAQGEPEVAEDHSGGTGADQQGTPATDTGAPATLSDILALVMSYRSTPERASTETVQAPLREEAGSRTAGLQPFGLDASGEDVTGLASAPRIGTSRSASGAKFAQSLVAGFGTATAASPEALPQAGAIAITVLNRETHFAPVRDHEAGVLNQLASAPAGAAETDSAKTGAAPNGDATAADSGLAASSARADQRAVPSADPRAQPVFETVAAARAAPAGPLAAPVRDRLDAQRHLETQIRAAASTAARASEARARGETGAVTLPPATRARTIEPTEREDAPLSRVADAIGEQPVTTTGAGQPGPGFTAGAPAFMPTASLAQIGEAIATELSRMSPETGSAPQQAGSGGPVRVLEIALSPEDLGRVTVRLRLTDAGLEVRLRASNPETARMLEQDHAALGTLLRSAGVEADTISISGADGTGATFVTTEAGQRTSQEPSDQRGQGEGERAPRDNTPNGSDRRQPRQNSGNGEPQDDRANPRRPGPDGGSFSV